MKTMILSAANVKKCLTPDIALNLVEYVFREWGLGNIVMPAKITLNMSRSGYDSWANAMPAFVVSKKAAGLKWIGGYANNQKQRKPYLQGIIILTDPQTGGTLAVMDGAFITNLRTGASAAIAGKYLAKREVKAVGIIGAGAQGVSCLTCLSRLYPTAVARVADISPEARTAFCGNMSRQTGMRVINCSSVEEAASGADIIVLVTTANAPLLKTAWISPGALTLGMSSFPQVEKTFALQADKIIVDSWEQASHRGELLPLVKSGKITEKNIYAELGKIVAGKKKGRHTETERILMVPVGLGAHDICMAQYVFEQAQKKGLGQWIEL